MPLARPSPHLLRWPCLQRNSSPLRFVAIEPHLQSSRCAFHTTAPCHAARRSPHRSPAARRVREAAAQPRKPGAPSAASAAQLEGNIDYNVRRDFLEKYGDILWADNKDGLLQNKLQREPFMEVARRLLEVTHKNGDLSLPSAQASHKVYPDPNVVFDVGFSICNGLNDNGLRFWLIKSCSLAGATMAVLMHTVLTLDNSNQKTLPRDPVFDQLERLAVRDRDARAMVLYSVILARREQYIKAHQLMEVALSRIFVIPEDSDKMMERALKVEWPPPKPMDQARAIAKKFGPALVNAMEERCEEDPDKPPLLVLMKVVAEQTFNVFDSDFLYVSSPWAWLIELEEKVRGVNPTTAAVREELLRIGATEYQDPISLRDYASLFIVKEGDNADFELYEEYMLKAASTGDFEACRRLANFYYMTFLGLFPKRGQSAPNGGRPSLPPRGAEKPGLLSFITQTLRGVKPRGYYQQQAHDWYEVGTNLANGHKGHGDLEEGMRALADLFVHGGDNKLRDCFLRRREDESFRSIIEQARRNWEEDEEVQNMLPRHVLDL